MLTCIHIFIVTRPHWLDSCLHRPGVCSRFRFASAPHCPTTNISTPPFNKRQCYRLELQLRIFRILREPHDPISARMSGVRRFLSVRDKSPRPKEGKHGPRGASRHHHGGSETDLVKVSAIPHHEACQEHRLGWPSLHPLMCLSLRVKRSSRYTLTTSQACICPFTDRIIQTTGEPNMKPPDPSSATDYFVSNVHCNDLDPLLDHETRHSPFDPSRADCM